MDNRIANAKLKESVKDLSFDDLQNAAASSKQTAAAGTTTLLDEADEVARHHPPEDMRVMRQATAIRLTACRRAPRGGKLAFDEREAEIEDEWIQQVKGDEAAQQTDADADSEVEEGRSLSTKRSSASTASKPAGSIPAPKISSPRTLSVHIVGYATV